MPSKTACSARRSERAPSLLGREVDAWIAAQRQWSGQLAVDVSWPRCVIAEPGKSLRTTGLTGRYSASAVEGLAYASFAMTTVLLRTYRAPRRRPRKAANGYFGLCRQVPGVTLHSCPAPAKAGVRQHGGVTR